MVAIEGVSGPALQSMINIGSLLSTDSSYENILLSESCNKILTNLQIIYDSICQINVIIQRIPEKCIPEFFFNNLRKYLSGSTDKTFFPDGLIITGSEKEITEPIRYGGGSAAQSSLIQAHDIFFGVTHTGHAHEFLSEMRKYMPQKHNIFLEHLASLPKLNNFISYIASNNKIEATELIDLYNKSLLGLVDFRKHHMKIVHNQLNSFG
jgi:indoleamine 2,3-dioxygenase